MLSAKISSEAAYRALQDIPGRADSDLPPCYWPECPVKHTENTGLNIVFVFYVLRILIRKFINFLA
jgi:hypothetical protein